MSLSSLMLLQSFIARKTYFNDKEKGLFIVKKRDVPPANPMTGMALDSFISFFLLVEFDFSKPISPHGCNLARSLLVSLALTQFFRPQCDAEHDEGTGARYAAHDRCWRHCRLRLQRLPHQFVNFFSYIYMVLLSFILFDLDFRLF
jgi:hypothetical protein